MRSIFQRGALALLVALCAFSLPLSIAGCAGALPLLVKASAIAGEVLAWIDRIVAFIGSNADLPPETKKEIDLRVEQARAAATALMHLARAGESVDRGEIESAKRDCIAAVQKLLDVVAPFGVQSLPPGMGTYGLAQDGAVLVVPTAADMVEAPQ